MRALPAPPRTHRRTPTRPHPTASPQLRTLTHRRRGRRPMLPCRRYRICSQHCAQPSLMLNGRVSRFCQVRRRSGGPGCRPGMHPNPFVCFSSLHCIRRRPAAGSITLRNLRAPSAAAAASSNATTSGGVRRRLPSSVMQRHGQQCSAAARQPLSSPRSVWDPSRRAAARQASCRPLRKPVGTCRHRRETAAAWPRSALAWRLARLSFRRRGCRKLSLHGTSSERSWSLRSPCRRPPHRSLPYPGPLCRGGYRARTTARGCPKHRCWPWSHSGCPAAPTAAGCIRRWGWPWSPSGCQAGTTAQSCPKQPCRPQT